MQKQNQSRGTVIRATVNKILVTQLNKLKTVLNAKPVSVLYKDSMCFFNYYYFKILSNE